MTNSKLIAKSDGTSLNEHCRKVAARARKIAETIGCDEHTAKLCEVAGLLHDIGKALPCYQAYLKASAKENAKVKCEEDAKFLPHNEYGAIFIEANLKAIRDAFGLSPLSNDADIRIVQLAVLTHHSYSYNAVSTIVERNKFVNGDGSELSHYGHVHIYPDANYDAKALADAFADLTGKEIPVETPNDNTCVSNRFLDHRPNYAATEHTVRAVLIRADWDVSSGTEWQREEWPAYGREIFEICPAQYDRERFDRQVGIAFDGNRRNTNVYNAPAGFGKTLLGIMLAMQTSRHVMWVCPRNEVCVSVFNGLKEDLTTLATANPVFAEVGVELVLAGERKNSFFGNSELSAEEPARITVTNIDRLTQPMACGNRGGLQVPMLDSVTIFDEYHEFVTESPMFFAFYTMLRAHYVLGVEQYLLSATPVAILHKWDNVIDIKFYPERDRHFPAQHSQPYTFAMTDEHPETLEEGTFAIFNAVKSAQAVQGDVICYNSYFTDEDRKAKRDLIERYYGKHSVETVKVPVASSPVIQASADYSAKSLYESIFSPMSTMQRIGRCNRHGEFGKARVVFVDSADKSEITAVSRLYDTANRNSWRDFLSANVKGKTLTLDDMYVLYDRFITEAGTSSDLVTYERELLNKSYKTLVTKCLSVRRQNTKDMDGNDRKAYALSANGTIRDPDPSFYYIVKEESSNRYYRFSASSSVLYREYDCGFSAYGKETNELYAAGLRLADPVNCGEYDVLAKHFGAITRTCDSHGKNFIKKLNSRDGIVLACRNPKTPFPVRKADMYYSHDKGIVNTVAPLELGI